MAGSVRIRTAEMRRFTQSAEGEVAVKIVRPVINKVSRRMHELCPKDSGELESKIYSKVYVWQGRLVGEAGSTAKHAPYVNNGTGIYGPHHTRVVSPTSGVMRWKDGGETVFARSTKGMKGTHFLEKSLEAIR